MITYQIEYKDRNGEPVKRKFATYEMARLIYHTLTEVGVKVSMTTNDSLIDTAAIARRAQHIADNITGRD